MTAAEFEELNELEAELWLAKRFGEFVASGFPPELALVLAVHPDIAVPGDETPGEPTAAESSDDVAA